VGPNRLYLGDCLDELDFIASDSVDAIVTDPPYGLSFMGKRWDYDVPSEEVWRECLRVLKPGGHLLAFAGTRTQHRMAVRIEDAGFEIRDMIAWVYGSGFPKSKNLDGDWQGWGTALKPALEPITMARKPLAGTVTENLLLHGVGGINVDGCRVPTDENLNGGAYAKIGNRGESQSLHGGSGMNQPGKTTGREFVQPTGRWPGNLIHDGSDEVLATFPQAPGQIAKAAEGGERRKDQHVYGVMTRGSNGAEPRADTGSAARFFYCAKASKSDRDAGLDAFPEVQTSVGDKRPGGDFNERLGKTPGGDFNERLGKTPGVRRNNHPTVKPTDLMRYLCRLVTPPGGVVLDPFTGSGSTGKAAVLEGFRFIGIEREAEYVRIAKARIEDAWRKYNDEEL